MRAALIGIRTITDAAADSGLARDEAGDLKVTA